MAGDAVVDADAEAEGGAAHGDVKNSTVLLGDLEEIRQKVERYRERASLTDHLSVKEAREAVASCYQCVPPPPLEPESLSHRPCRANPTTTLNCWSEVAAFRSSVSELEQVCDHFRASLHSSKY
jgi:altered-inheritance-of-mitochondria protein 13